MDTGSGYYMFVTPKRESIARCPPAPKKRKVWDAVRNKESTTRRDLMRVFNQCLVENKPGSTGYFNSMGSDIQWKENGTGMVLAWYFMDHPYLERYINYVVIPDLCKIGAIPLEVYELGDYKGILDLLMYRTLTVYNKAQVCDMIRRVSK